MIDTPARPDPDELKTVAEGCDLLILPSSPDAMALTAMVQMVEALHSLKSNYRILLTLIPPAPSKVGIESRRTIEKAELPIFKAEIRRLAVFQKAALAGFLSVLSKMPMPKLLGVVMPLSARRYCLDHPF